MFNLSQLNQWGECQQHEKQRSKWKTILFTHVWWLRVSKTNAQCRDRHKLRLWPNSMWYPKADWPPHKNVNLFPTMKDIWKGASSFALESIVHQSTAGNESQFHLATKATELYLWSAYVVVTMSVVRWRRMGGGGAFGSSVVIFHTQRPLGGRGLVFWVVH